jgi:hypothetical protein
MSTHCMIGRASADGTIRAIYVHFDGGPDKKYPLLNAFLDDEQDIDKLLAKGDLRSLGTRGLNVPGTRNKPSGRVILAVDVLDPAVPARQFDRMPDFLRGASHEGAHYVYLWIEGMWISFREKQGSWETMPITPGWTATEMFAYCSGVAAR